MFSNYSLILLEDYFTEAVQKYERNKIARLTVMDRKQFELTIRIQRKNRIKTLFVLRVRRALEGQLIPLCNRMLDSKNNLNFSVLFETLASLH